MDQEHVPLSLWCCKRMSNVANESWVVSANLDKHILNTKAWRKEHAPWGIWAVDWSPAQLFTDCVTMDDDLVNFNPPFQSANWE